MPRSIIPDPTTVQDGPDLDGWRDAMERLRTALGTVATFLVPQAKTWDPSVALDPETGEPYDPTVVPVTGGGYDEIEAKAGVVFRPIRMFRPEAATQVEASGIQDTDTVALLISESTYVTVQNAARFRLYDRQYRITEMIADGLTRTDRYIIYGEAE